MSNNYLVTLEQILEFPALTLYSVSSTTAGKICGYALSVARSDRLGINQAVENLGQSVDAFNSLADSLGAYDFLDSMGLDKPMDRKVEIARWLAIYEECKRVSVSHRPESPLRIRPLKDTLIGMANQAKPLPSDAELSQIAKLSGVEVGTIKSAKEKARAKELAQSIEDMRVAAQLIGSTSPLEEEPTGFRESVLKSIQSAKAFVAKYSDGKSTEEILTDLTLLKRVEDLI